MNGAERANPLVFADAVLEKAGGKDESLKELRDALYAARENGHTEISLVDGNGMRMGVPVWKIMEVRRRAA